MNQVFVAAIFIVAAISMPIDGRPSASDKPCNEAADILFLVDTSSSIWPGFFNKEVKTFLKDIISSFNIGPGPLDTRVGIVLFSNREYLEFHLNQYQTVEDLVKAVDGIRFRGGDTYTHRALEFVTNEMLLPGHGSREGVKKLLVILTDGKSADAKKTKLAAEALKATGADIFAIGVGTAVDFEELHDMASTPTGQFVFQVTDFRALDSIKQSFTQSTCEVLTTTTTTTTTRTTTPSTTTTTTTPSTTPTTPTTTTTTPTTTPTTTTSTTTRTTTQSTTSEERLQGDQAYFDEACRGKPADIYFLLDASSSVWIGHFHDRVLPFVRDLVSSFHISPLHTRVGLVTFSNDVNHEFSLSEHSNLKSLLAAIQPEHVDYLTGGTNTGDAIEYVSNHGFGSHDARRGVAQIIITVTDGLSQVPRRTAQAAAEARQKGVYMFAVGVGKLVDEQELADISSNPDEDFVFSVDDFKALSSITELLALKTCKAVAEDNNKDLRPSDQVECAKRPSNVMFVYEYLNSVSASKAIVEQLISQFTNDVVAVAPHVKVGAFTQPCVGGSISLLSVTKFQEALYELRTNYYMGYSGLVRKLRMEGFGNIPETEQRVAVMVVDEMTRDLDLLQREVAKLKLNNVKVVVVAVGNVNEAALEKLASMPNEDHIFRVDNYSSLKNNKLTVTSILCGRSSTFNTYDVSGSRNVPSRGDIGVPKDVGHKYDFDLPKTTFAPTEAPTDKVYKITTVAPNFNIVHVNVRGDGDNANVIVEETNTLSISGTGGHRKPEHTSETDDGEPSGDGTKLVSDDEDDEGRLSTSFHFNVKPN